MITALQHCSGPDGDGLLEIAFPSWSAAVKYTVSPEGSGRPCLYCATAAVGLNSFALSRRYS
jgi:hypothetical protein